MPQNTGDEYDQEARNPPVLNIFPINPVLGLTKQPTLKCRNRRSGNTCLSVSLTDSGTCKLKHEELWKGPQVPTS
jgi:hypothetical protein